ncbi:hypothetical protein RJ641_019471 [Dillenia turbinata]|uniref:AB hydrolase-1 domain-containing protein n=1 Tax=Dillenia turbinata TaxID=194707 RepID=A0AAN8UJ90_9MAGN
MGARYLINSLNADRQKLYSIAHFEFLYSIAFVVGHDWGAEVAWHFCLFRPNRVQALVNISIPYRQQSPELKPTQAFNQVFGDGFYVTQFQVRDCQHELSSNIEEQRSHFPNMTATILKKLLFINAPDPLAAAPGVEIIDFLETPSSLPPWITQEELEFNACWIHGRFALLLNWKQLRPRQGLKIAIPTKFVNIGFQSFGTKDYINGEVFKSSVPDLEVLVIDGHHFIQLEKAKEVTQAILSFFKNQSLP